MTDSLVLRNALLIDGTGAAPRPDATVVATAENPIDRIGLFEDGLKNVVMVIQGGAVVKDRLG